MLETLLPLDPLDGDGAECAPQGAAYRAFASEIGVPCPDSLVVLADAMATRGVYHAGWGLLALEDARGSHAWLKSLVADHPCMAPRAAMLPVLGRDGDLLLIHRDGSTWLFELSGGQCDHGPVAPTFDALLDRLFGPPIVGEVSHHAFRFVDGIEYSMSVTHRCAPTGCSTAFHCDLAPHVIRPRGKHALSIAFAEARPTEPRREPVGEVALAGSRLDLRDVETSARLVRKAHREGWTGRAGPFVIEDGRTWLAG